MEKNQEEKEDKEKSVKTMTTIKNIEKPIPKKEVKQKKAPIEISKRELMSEEEK